MFYAMTEERSGRAKLLELQDLLRAVVGKRLTAARNDMNRSQPDALKELKRHGLDRTQGSLSQIEQGTRLPSVEILYTLAKYYDASVDHILGLSEDTRSMSDIIGERSGAMGGLGAILDALPKERQQQVVAFAEFLLSQERAANNINIDRWVADTEVLLRRYGESSEDSFAAALLAEHPSLATDLGILPKQKAAQEG